MRSKIDDNLVKELHKQSKTVPEMEVITGYSRSALYYAHERLDLDRHRPVVIRGKRKSVKQKKKGQIEFDMMRGFIRIRKAFIDSLNRVKFCEERAKYWYLKTVVAMKLDFTKIPIFVDAFGEDINNEKILKELEEDLARYEHENFEIEALFRKYKRFFILGIDEMVKAFEIAIKAKHIEST